MIPTENIEAMRQTLVKRDQEIKELKVELAGVRRAFCDEIKRRMAREEEEQNCTADLPELMDTAPLYRGNEAWEELPYDQV